MAFLNGRSFASNKYLGALSRISHLDRTVVVDIIYSGVANLSEVLWLILMVLTARVLGANDFGVFSFALSVASIFFILPNFGLNAVAIRDVARDRGLASRYLTNILSWKVILSLISLLSLVGFTIYSSGLSQQVRIVVGLVGLAVMLKFLTVTGRAFFQALKRFDLEAFVVIIEQILLLSTGATILLLGYGLIALTSTILIVRLLGCILIFILLRELLSSPFLFEPRFILRLQIHAIPVGVAFLAMTGYLQIDTLILSYTHTYREVGLYNAAFKVYTALFIFPAILCSVLLPSLSSSYANDKKKLQSLFSRSVLYLALISVPVSVVGMLFSEKILSGVFGEQFLDATFAMQILLGVTIFTFQIWLLRTFLISINGQHALMGLNVVALCLRIAFDLILIPRYGIVGAAMATGMSELLLFCGMWIYLLRNHFRVASVAKWEKQLSSPVDL